MVVEGRVQRIDNAKDMLTGNEALSMSFSGRNQNEKQRRENMRKVQRS